MAKRITPEQIKEINEVYYRCKIKTKTAQIVGVSVASVTKYLIPDYVPDENLEIKKFSGELKGCLNVVKMFKEALDPVNYLRSLRLLSEEEQEELLTFQKDEVII